MDLLLNVGTWFATNWPMLLIIVLAIALLIPTYLRQRKEMNAKNELINSISKGTKIVTTAGVYGVVDSIEETTDGKVVTIVTGNDKNPTTMKIHINAIMGIDNKTAVVEKAEEPVSETKVEENVESKDEVASIKKELREATKKKTTKTVEKKSE